MVMSFVILSFQEGIHQQVRVTNGRNPCTEIIYIVLQTSYCATILNIFSKEIISNIKCREQILFIETLESTGEMKLIMKLYLWLYNFSELTLKFIFSSSYGKLFLVLFQAIIYSFNF